MVIAIGLVTWRRRNPRPVVDDVKVGSSSTRSARSPHAGSGIGDASTASMRPAPRPGLADRSRGRTSVRLHASVTAHLIALASMTTEPPAPELVDRSPSDRRRRHPERCRDGIPSGSGGPGGEDRMVLEGHAGILTRARGAPLILAWAMSRAYDERTGQRRRGSLISPPGCACWFRWRGSGHRRLRSTGTTALSGRRGPTALRPPASAWRHSGRK